MIVFGVIGYASLWLGLDARSALGFKALSRSENLTAVNESTQAYSDTSKASIHIDPLSPTHYRKTVLVTGGAGFVGSHVAEALLTRGDKVVIVDNLNNYYSVAKKLRNLEIVRNHTNTSADTLQIYQGDICNQTLLDEIFRDTRPDHVCHLAARAGVRPSVEDPFIYVQANVEGTTHLLEMARLYNITNFVYASSSSVYGGLQRKKFSEEEPQLDFPWSQYAATKRSTELLAATYHHLYNLSTSGLRFFTVYGPRGRPDMAPYKFIDRVSRGLQIQQYGDGTAVRDFTFIDDIVDGILRSIDRPYPCEVFNLGRGQGIMLRDFIALVEHYTGRKANITVLPRQTGDVPYTMADTTKANHLLGFTPQVTFAEGIRQTVQWYNETILSAH